MWAGSGAFWAQWAGFANLVRFGSKDDDPAGQNRVMLAARLEPMGRTWAEIPPKFADSGLCGGARFLPCVYGVYS